MYIKNLKDLEEKELGTVMAKGKNLPVEGTTVKWLSQVGDEGLPEYGLRLFTIKPGGYIPDHLHPFAQTQVILAGRLLVSGYKDGQREEKELGPGDFFYVSPMELHGMKNVGNEPVTFFCCICVLAE